MRIDNSGVDRTRALAPLAGVIESAAGQPVEIRLYADPDALARAIAAGEVDVAVLNLGAWLRAAHAPGVLPLAVLVPAPDVQEPGGRGGKAGDDLTGFGGGLGGGLGGGHARLTFRKPEAG